MVQEKSGVEQIDADNSEGLLLQAVLMIQHSNMNNDAAIFIARVGLELYAHPAVAFVGALVVAGLRRPAEFRFGPVLSARRHTLPIWDQNYSIGMSGKRL